jgi:hypothetical protein
MGLFVAGTVWRGTLSVVSTLPHLLPSNSPPQPLYHSGPLGESVQRSATASTDRDPQRAVRTSARRRTPTVAASPPPFVVQGWLWSFWWVVWMCSRSQKRESRSVGVYVHARACVRWWKRRELRLLVCVSVAVCLRWWAHELRCSSGCLCSRGCLRRRRESR